MVPFHSLLLVFLSLSAFATKLLQRLSFLWITFISRLLCAVNKKRCIWASISMVQLLCLSDGFTFPEDAFSWPLWFSATAPCLPKKPDTSSCACHKPSLTARLLLQDFVGHQSADRSYRLNPASVNHHGRTIKDCITVCARGGVS